MARGDWGSGEAGLRTWASRVEKQTDQVETCLPRKVRPKGVDSASKAGCEMA